MLTEEIVESLESRVEAMEKKLTVVNNKFDQIQVNMEHYEKWYVDLLTKANETVKETRKFLSKFTDDDIKQLERIINAIHGD